MMKHLHSSTLAELLGNFEEEETLGYQAWSVISVKGNDIAQCCEHFRREEHKIAELLCDCLHQTCVSCWVDDDERGIEIALKPGVSHKYLRKANQILKELKYDMSFRAVFRKDRNHWKEGTLVKIKDPLDKTDYEGTIQKAACTNWMEVHWRNAEGEKCQCRLSRHHRHLSVHDSDTIPDCSPPKETITHNDLTDKRKKAMFEEFSKLKIFLSNVYEKMDQMQVNRRASQIAKNPLIHIASPDGDRESAQKVKLDRRYKIPSVAQGIGDEFSEHTSDGEDMEGSPQAQPNIPDLELPEESNTPRVHDRVWFKRKKKGNKYEGTIIEVRESATSGGAQMKVKFIKKGKKQEQWIDNSQLIETQAERNLRKGLKKRDSFFHNLRQEKEAKCVIS